MTCSLGSSSSSEAIELISLETKSLRGGFKDEEAAELFGEQVVTLEELELMRFMTPELAAGTELAFRRVELVDAVRDESKSVERVALA